MKRLLSIPKFGLLLSCLTVSIRSEDDVIKLCDPDLKENLIQLCQGSRSTNQRSNSPIPDTDETDYYTDMYLKIQTMYDKYGFQLGSPPLLENPSYNGYRQTDLMSEDIREFVAKSAQMGKNRSRKLIPFDLDKTQALDKCCKNGCTISEILSELCWKK